MNPPLLLIPSAEEQITKALDTLFRDRTVLIIAHRLQTVKKSDTIMVIE
jgi:ABC-type multidrug transport system fused ATPase/permease subunit